MTTEWIRALAIQSGQVRIPLACEHCGSRILFIDRDAPTQQEYYRAEPNYHLLACMACGRHNTWLAVHELRRRKIAAYIRDGASTPTTRR